MEKTKVLQVFAIVFAALGMTAAAAAQNPNSEASDNATVTVTISDKIAVDLSPAALDFGSLDPGQFDAEAGNFPSVEIENIGSKNITGVWMNATTPSDSPFGTGVSDQYDTGNFIQIKPTENIAGVNTYDTYTYVNRKEFNETNDLSYIFTPTTENNDGDWRYGRFRAGEQEVFWAVNATQSGDSCYTSAANDGLRVGNVAHNQTNTGSNDFTDSSGEYTTYDLVSGTNNAIARDVWVNTSESQKQYDVVANCGSSDTWVMRTRYNVNAAGEDLSTGGTAEYLLDYDGSTDTMLQPGEHFAVETALNVPLGVAQGDINSGLLRVMVNTAT